MQAPASPVLAGLIRQVAGDMHPDRIPDAELLSAFITGQDGVAFAELVSRYGPLVWGVCRRGLTDANDAEDAFQATFLALARQAQLLADRAAGHDNLVGWLYTTARRIAHNLRRSRARRSAHEQRAAADRSPLATPAAEPVSDLGSMLDEELSRLPARFRDPLVLCYFQGKTHAAAARQLGCPVGSVSSRLARGCELLRANLARRGVALGVGQIGVALLAAGAAGRAAAATVVPVKLVQATVSAARSLAAGEAVVTEAGRLAAGVSHAGWGLKVKLMVLLLVAAAGATTTAALVTEDAARPARGEVSSAAPADPVRETGGRTDRFGDPLPEGAVARLGTVRFRIGQMGRGTPSLAFGPGGKQLISAHGADVVYFWDPTTGREVRRLEAPKSCTSVSATRDGRRLVGCGHTETWAWDLTADPPQVLWKVKARQVVYGGVEFSPDGRLVALGNDKQADVALLDAATGEAVRTLPAAGSGFAFSADSKRLAVWVRSPGLNAAAGADVSVWDVTAGTRRHTLAVRAAEAEPATGHMPEAVGVAFAPDGKTVAAAGRGRLRLWDADTGAERGELAKDTAPQAFVGFTPDGTLVEAGGGRIRYWNVTTGKAARPAVATVDTAEVFHLSADGTRLAGAGLFGVGVRELPGGRDIGPPSDLPNGIVHSLAFAPDGRGLVMATYSEAAGAALHLWDAGTGQLRRRVAIGPGQIIGAIDVAPGGAVSAACVPMYKVPSPPSRVVTWDANLAKEQASYALPAGARSGAPSPDGKTFAVSARCRVALCDRATGQEVREISGACDAASLAFSADGNWLGAIDAAAKRVVVWSLADGRETTWTPPPDLAGRPTPLLAPLALSPNGRLIALHGTGGMRGSVRVVEMATGADVYELAAHADILPFQEFAFAPDGRTIATAGRDGVVRVWELAGGGERFRFSGHRAGLFSVAYSPDSRRVASASYDSTALVWDVSRPPRQGQARPLSPEASVAALSNTDAGVALRAVAALADAPAASVPLLRARLRPPAIPHEQVKRWLADLGSEQFAAREAASRELSRCGDAVLPDLKRALAATASAEARARLERLIVRLGARSADALAVVRGVEALERMGANPAARALLTELAAAPADTLLGREARAACRRLDAQQ